MGIIKYGYCGIDCDACNRHSKEIKDSAVRLRTSIDAKGVPDFVDKIAEHVPKLNNFREFYEILKWFAEQERMNTGNCPKCRAGGGIPTCEVRNCAEEKGLNFCYECNDFPCHLLHPRMVKESESCMVVMVKT